MQDSYIAYYLFRARIECEQAFHHKNRPAALAHLGLAIGYIGLLQQHLTPTDEQESDRQSLCR